MILELLLVIPAFIIMWFIIFKVMLKYYKRKLIKNISKRLESQTEIFYNDGKPVSLIKILGLEDKKEVVKPTRKFKLFGKK